MPEHTTDAPAPTKTTRRALAADAAALLPGLFAYGALAFAVRAFVTDDALITLRYARHWAQGIGLRWNPGEDPVEGFSNFSHALLGAAAIALDLPALAVLRLCNALAALGLVAVSYALARRALGDRRFAGAAALLVGAHPALAFWSVSGLETASYACALLLGVWAVDAGRGRLAFAAFLVAALTRFEGAIATLVVAGVYSAPDLLRGRTAALKRTARWLVPWLALYGLYFAARYHYFGHALSNSAYSKATGAGGDRLIMEFAWQNAVLLLLVPLAPYRRLGALGVALLALIALYVAGYYGVRPSVSYYHRFFLPVFAPAALLAVAAAHRLWSAPRLRAVCAPLGIAALLAAFAWDLGHDKSGVPSVVAHAERMATRIVSRTKVAAFIADHYPASARVMVQDVGVIGYALTNPILDSFGLNSELFTHTLARRRTDYLRILLASEPDVIVLVSKRPGRFVHLYTTDQIIAALATAARYHRVYTVRSSAERYHYQIYARAPLASAEPGPVQRSIDPAAGTAAMLESTARAIWRAQRR